MNNAISDMLKKYDIKNTQDETNAIKEIVQEIVLCGLSRGGFFNEAAFYGGTALRIFYGLDRFSEDLDFSLIEPNPQFDITKYFSFIENEVNAYGLNMKIMEKEKSIDSNIASAFLKGDTKEHILMFFPDDKIAFNNNSLGNIKIKFEIDTNPPAGASYQTKMKLLPSPHQVKLYDEESLFAGKIHALLCRNWKTRVKGRDLYDFIFYISHNTKVNMDHLKQKLIESNYIERDFCLNNESLKEMLINRFSEIDFIKAKDDVVPFINDFKKVDLWSKDFFADIVNGYCFE